MLLGVMLHLPKTEYKGCMIKLQVTSKDWYYHHSQQAYTCLILVIKTLKEGVKYVQS